jgi:hypothetical protein
VKGYTIIIIPLIYVWESDTRCVTQMSFEFAPFAPVDFDGDGSKEDAYTVTSGFRGEVGPSSAAQSDSHIIFRFANPVCPGQLSYVFGLASAAEADGTDASPAQIVLSDGSTEYANAYYMPNVFKGDA